MFNFLKDKLKETVSKFSSKVEESTETEEEVKEEVKIEENESKEETKVEVEEKKKIKEEVKEEPKEKEQTEEEVKEKKSFLGKIKEKVTTTKVSEKKFDEFFWDLEVAMLENNVASEVIEKIKEDLRTDIVDQPLKRGKVEEIVKDSLKESIDSLFMNYKDLLKSIKEGEKPFIIVFVGVNGSGKTTTIAKIANLVKKNNLNSVMVAADTFRAAAIQQIQ